MKEKRRLAAIVAPWLFPFLMVAGSLSGQEASERPAFTIEELFGLVREGSPRLRAAGYQVEAARSREAEAGLLPDPTLMVGVANLALPEFSASMPASMVPSLQATQRFPLAGKRSLREDLARRSTEIAGAAADQVWWNIRTEAALAFYELYRIDRQVEVMAGTLSLLQDFETVALSRYTAGTGLQTDVLRAGVESARMEGDIERMAALRAGIASRLNALADRAADTPIPTPDIGAFPAETPPPDILSQWATEHRPALQELRIALQRAETNRELAGKAIWPDLTLGIQYALGRMDGDPRSMGGASVGFSLPVYAGKRQRKLEEEAAAMEGMARARLDEALASLGADIGQTLAELDQARTLLALYREDILPQARAAVESSFASYRVGAVDFMALIDSQMAVNRFEGEYFQLLASYGASLARLEMIIGRDLPVTGNSIVEIR